MEESLDLIRRETGTDHSAADLYSPLTLAFVGDAVFELFVRSVLAARANRPAHELHEEAVKYVCAGSQSKMTEALRGMFSEKEEHIYKRGRNAYSKTVPKHATAGEYRRATGLEAVIGWLYLSGNTARAVELLKAGMEAIE